VGFGGKVRILTAMILRINPRPLSGFSAAASGLLVALFSVFALSAQPHVDAYIKAYGSSAVEEMQRYKIPASITMAQGMLESNYGRSKLATEAHNHFGIKCPPGWEGKSMRHDDDKPQECFKAYKDASESFRDHSLFLAERSRYAALFELRTTDYKGWAKGLSKAGYATNPNYASLLIDLIERYKLDSLDRLGAERVRYRSANRLPYTLALRGDRWSDLSDWSGKDVEDLKRWNDCERCDRPVEGAAVYLKKKKKRAKAHEHRVEYGETLLQISQMHGIRLESLREINGFQPDFAPEPGTVLRLK